MRFLIALALVFVGCGGGGDGTPPVETACNNGLDDDFDGNVDLADPGCSDATDTDESNVPIAACGDGKDNDGDGLVDFPNDPGCSVAQQDDEADDCPNGPACPACANGIDDDGDGQTDYPADTGCKFAGQRDEFGFDPNACGGAVELMQLTGVAVNGSIPSGQGALAATCGGEGDEVAYAFAVNEPRVVVVSVTGLLDFDPIVSLRSSCQDPNSELACNDNVSAGEKASRLRAAVTPGVYYIVVDSTSTTGGGSFRLQVDQYLAEGEACAPQLPSCAPGLVCREIVQGQGDVCSQPRCNDGMNNDADSATDYPADPGCAAPSDDDETDVCPNGMGCPACGNGVDDDADGQIDYGMDSGCTSASQPIESCGVEKDSFLVAESGTVTGTTSGASSDYTAMCGSSSTSPDVVILLDIPAMQSLRLDNMGTTFDSVLALTGLQCQGELACADVGGNGGESVTRANLAAGLYAVVIDGYFGGQGAFTVHVQGTIAAGARCDGALAAAGAISCDSGYTCTGGICVGALACNDLVDADGDGDAGWPSDPGCESPVDTTEEDDCPAGPNCPQCANGQDDDGDGQIDYPTDAVCVSASSTSESCASAEGVLPLVQPTTGVDLSSATSEQTLSCAFSTAPDVTFALDLPALTSLRISDDAFSSMSLTGSNCVAEVACDSSELVLGATAAGRYYLHVENGFSDIAEVTVAGAIAAGGSCEVPLAQSGALICAEGFSCSGPMNARTCQPAACNDLIDQDGDGFAGYPMDPGCTSASDADESDSCPGAGCPVCANDLDDDGDGAFDYPADVGCSSAAGTTEAFCAIESSPIVTISIPAYAGTTVGRGDDFSASCGGAGSPDVIYALNLPVPVATLTIDTVGSAFDTILALRDATCSTQLQCDDEGGGGGTSRITRTNVAAGAYGIQVDGWSNDSGNYNLSVRGIVAPNAACTNPLFTSGVLVCPANHTCTAGTCQPI